MSYDFNDIMKTGFIKAVEEQIKTQSFDDLVRSVGEPMVGQRLNGLVGENPTRHQIMQAMVNCFIDGTIVGSTIAYYDRSKVEARMAEYLDLMFKKEGR